MPFQFQVHLDAELRRVLGEVEVAVPTPILAELALLADHDRDARAAQRLAKNYRIIESRGAADGAPLHLPAGDRAGVGHNQQPLPRSLKAAGVPPVFLP